MALQNEAPELSVDERTYGAIGGGQRIFPYKRRCASAHKARGVATPHAGRLRKCSERNVKCTSWLRPAAPCNCRLASAQREQVELRRIRIPLRDAEMRAAFVEDFDIPE